MASELRKDRLAFVSGTILVWGILLVRSWPSVATFQTGRHIHLWTANLPGQGVITGLWIFWQLTAVLTLGGLAVALAVAHILSYGLLVITETGQQQGAIPTQFQTSLDRLCAHTYTAVFIQWFIVLCLLGITVLVLLSAGLEQFLARFLAAGLAGWVSRMSVFILLMMIFGLQWRRISKKIDMKRLVGRLAQNQNAFAFYLVSLFGFLFLWLLVLEFCNTVTLAIDARVLRHDQGATITVELGGATSDPREASLQLIDEKGNEIRPLAFREINEGSYLAYLPPGSLPAGFYRVILQYPHTSITTSFPYIRRITKRSQAFLVPP